MADIRQTDYRNDLLPVEKAVGLVGKFTFKESYTFVKEGRIGINDRIAVVGDWVTKKDTLYLDDVPLPQRQVSPFALTRA